MKKLDCGTFFFNFQFGANGRPFKAYGYTFWAIVVLLPSKMEYDCFQCIFELNSNVYSDSSERVREFCCTLLIKNDLESARKCGD
jgi:phage major head subunit gpT-like protein